MEHKIEFFCDEKYKGCLPEPQLNYKNIPKWYVNTPMIQKSKCPFKFLIDNNVDKNVNIKGCPAVTDFLTYGYTIPAWTNFLIRDIDDKFYMNWENDDDIKYHFHGIEQYEGMGEHEVPIYDGFHKVMSPWRIKTSPGISCLITHPYWGRENRFTSVSAVIHPDVCPLQIQWFFEWNYKLTEEIDYEFQTIKRGHPLIYILPFKRDKFKLNINYETTSRINQIDNQIRYQSQDWFNDNLYKYMRKSIGRLFS